MGRLHVFLFNFLNFTEETNFFIRVILKARTNDMYSFENAREKNYVNALSASYRHGTLFCFFCFTTEECTDLIVQQFT